MTTVCIFANENVHKALTLCEGDTALGGDWGGRLSPVDGGHGDNQEVSSLYFFSSPLLSFLLSFLCVGVNLPQFLLAAHSKKNQSLAHTYLLQLNVTEDIEVDIYTTFMSPGIEDQQSAFSVRVPQVRPHLRVVDGHATAD